MPLKVSPYNALALKEAAEEVGAKVAIDFHALVKLYRKGKITEEQLNQVFCNPDIVLIH